MLSDAGSQDETNLLMNKMNQANDLSTFNLTMAGYQGRSFQVQCEKAADLLPITMPHTKERIELLEKSSSHGQRFFETRGTHVTEDDLFCAAQVPAQDAKIKVMEVIKTQCARLDKVSKEVKAVLELVKPISALLKSEFGKAA